MKVNRENLLKQLESVSVGLAKREIIEQSQCFVFTGGEVLTFNDEVAVRTPSKLDIEGAVEAKPLLELLKKLNEDAILIDKTEEGLMIKGKNRRSVVRMENEVLIPVENIENPGNWSKIPENLLKAMKMASSCCSSDESSAVLACVHIAGDFVEATDDVQIIRYKIETGIDDAQTLVRFEAVNKIVSMEPHEWSHTKDWIHFRDASGLTISSRRYIESYPNVDNVLGDSDGLVTKFPKHLEKVLDKAVIFSSENPVDDKVLVAMNNGLLKIKGYGPSGWYEEKKKIEYTGEPIAFNIDPKLLIEISRRNTDCKILGNKMRIETGNFIYLVCMSLVED